MSKKNKAEIKVEHPSVIGKKKQLSASKSKSVRKAEARSKSKVNTPLQSEIGNKYPCKIIEV